MSENKALFLDRDGVINVDHGYVYKKEEFEFVDGIYDVCLKAQENDFKLIIVTNQAGIGRGYYTQQDFDALMRWVCDEFKKRALL
jgi:D-glycero-D-manno-heptose 1,7-bisphosphate phosphatase